MVLDVGGVGYLVNIPTSQNRRPPERGETLLLYTFLQLRENDVSLYGFYTHEELEIFKTLLTVPGIGPRTALAVISVFSPEALRDALTRGDFRSGTQQFRRIGRAQVSRCGETRRSRPISL